ncbi:MAG: hypothetical protein COT74_12370 [Bdellovibrionales bacterium CG10_big_fil_rev_8_21_14_0_10_45_34]|nr:MAG: hypothetical protein COT74_12370 [Bdellovibrionales bacterium CG10_big_fil_rev_8_21_14_0_10_45_34]
MARPLVIVVTDDNFQGQRMSQWAESQGFQVKVYSQEKWNQGVEHGSLRTELMTREPSLVGGAGVHSAYSNVVPFPGVSHSSIHDPNKTKRMDELECDAIKKAIYEYRGNLTEAAKALGIGRATLYRKVKQFNIDPSEARRQSGKAA